MCTFEPPPGAAQSGRIAYSVVGRLRRRLGRGRRLARLPAGSGEMSVPEGESTQLVTGGTGGMLTRVAPWIAVTKAVSPAARLRPRRGAS